MTNQSYKAVKAGFGYTVGNILIKGISFLTLPLFSRLMTTEEFGIYNVFISCESILFVIMGLAIHTSIRNANIEFRGKIDEYTSSVSLIYILNLVLFSGFVLLWGDPLGRFLGFSKPILFMLVLYSFGSAVITLYNNRIALDYSYAKYLTVALINTVANIGLSLLLIFTTFRTSKDFGRIVGATISLLSLAIVLLISLFQKSKPKYNNKYWHFAIKYSLPIVPHGVSQVLLAQFDRIMIRALVSNSAVGIYSLAGNLKLILSLISDSITTAWATWFYDQLDKGHITEIQKRANQLCGMFSLLSIGLMAISPELIFILGGSEYIEGKYVAIPMIADAFLLSVYSIIVQIEYYKKRTTYVMLGTLIATLINTVTNYIFIKKFGFIAAAYTTLFSYLVYLAMHLYISKKLACFYILKPKFLFTFSALVTLAGMFSLIFSNSILLRWGFCFAEIVMLSYWLHRDIGLAKILSKFKLKL